MKQRIVLFQGAASRFLPAFAGGVALCLAAWLAADLFWRFFSPRSSFAVSAVQSDPVASARSVAGRHFMGAHQIAAAVSVASGWSLTGLTTSAPGHPGFAVLAQAGGLPQGVREGEEIAAGVVLRKIFPDGVELSSGGLGQRVALMSTTPAPVSSSPVPAASNPSGGAFRQTSPPSVALPVPPPNNVAGAMPVNSQGAVIPSSPASMQ